MQSKPVLLLFPLILLFGTCSIDEDNDSDHHEYRYPLSVGNVWRYQRDYNSYFYFASDTATTKQYEDTVSISSIVTVTVTGTTQLLDSIETYEVISNENADDIYTSISYYQNRTEGLFIIAYISYGPLIMPKMNPQSRLVFKGMSFENYHQLADFLQQITPIGKVVADSLYFEDPPLKVLPYPLSEGEQWTYRADMPYRIDKIVESRERITIDDEEYDCTKIRFLYDLDTDGIWDEDIKIEDYIADEGLIRRQITVMGVQETSTSNPEGTGRLIDIFDDYTLFDYHLQEDYH